MSDPLKPYTLEELEAVLKGWQLAYHREVSGTYYEESTLTLDELERVAATARLALARPAPATPSEFAETEATRFALSEIIGAIELDKVTELSERHLKVLNDLLTRRLASATDAHPDTARLDWLEANRGGREQVVIGTWRAVETTLRAAIDAARSGTAAPPEAP